MNVKTRKELNKLADIMSEDENLDGALETNTFLNLAMHLADKNNVALSTPTIKLYEEWLRCKVFDILDECDLQECEEDVLDELFGGSDDVNYYTPLYDENGSEVDWSVMLDNLKSIINRLEKNQTFKQLTSMSSVTSPNSSKKVYTVFDVKDDSVVVTRGAYSKPPFAGMTPKEINELRGWPCMAGWADGLLTENEKLGPNRVGSLTKDDIDVLQKIKRNEI
jgi:hypothetical protein